MTLTEAFNKHGTDKGSSGHDLGDVYEPHFKSTNIKRVIEIGVYKGASVNAFADYFGQECKVVGIDINQYDFDKLPNVTTVKGSSTDFDFTQSVVRMFEGNLVDLVLDDGSHKVEDQIITLKLFINYVATGGLYIVEDVRMSDAGTLLTSLPDCVKIVGWYRYPRKPEMLTCILRKR